MQDLSLFLNYTFQHSNAAVLERRQTPRLFYSPLVALSQQIAVKIYQKAQFSYIDNRNMKEKLRLSSIKTILLHANSTETGKLTSQRWTKTLKLHEYKDQNSGQTVSWDEANKIDSYLEPVPTSEKLGWNTFFLFLRSRSSFFQTRPHDIPELRASIKA